MKTDIGRYQEARAAIEQQLPKGIAVDFEALFPRLSGWGVERKNRKRLELLNRVAPVLAGALELGETIEFVTRGVVNLWWEQVCMGLWAQMINGTTLVCTNQRVLLIHTSSDVPKSYINQVPRDAVRKVSGGLGSLTVKLGSGSIVLSGVPGTDKKILTQQLRASTRGRGGKEFLCPKCYRAYQTHTTECAQCGATFKSPAVAARRSLLLPGLGDYYLGHQVLAGLEICGSLMVWLVVVLMIGDSLDNGDMALTLAIALGMILVTHGVDAALTHAQGKKGLMALDDKLATGPKTAATAHQPQPRVPVPITPR